MRNSDTTYLNNATRLQNLTSFPHRLV